MHPFERRSVRIGQALALGSRAVLLLVFGAGDALANSGSWSQAGYTLYGQTNPVDYSTQCPCGTCGPACPGTNDYRAASFSQTPNGSAWVGALNQAGDMCSNGQGNWNKAQNGWNWLWNQPNTWVSAMTGWVASENCPYGTTHTYQVQGTHNLQNGDASVNFSGATVSTN